MGKGDVRKKHRANSMGAQWWRKLSLPRRGKKESLLTPNPDGLPDALCARVAKRRSRLRKAVEAPRAARAKALAVADWDAARGLARVVTPRGNALASMGFYENGSQWLFPEEAAYLVDRAQMDLRVDGVPASLQRTWGLMVEGLNAVTLDEFCAFAHLRRVGYVVRRYGMDKVDEEALNREAEMEVAGQSHGRSGRRKKSRANKMQAADAEDDTMHDSARKASHSTPVEDGDGIGGFREVEMSEPTLLQDSQKAAVTRGLLARDALKPSFSVWRVGAYRRRNTHRPLFNLLVSRYEDAPPRHSELTSLLASCTGKTRLRVALIDRGVVVLIDVANNATPLSSRYTSRLPRPAEDPVEGTSGGTAIAAYPSLGSEDAFQGPASHCIAESRDYDLAIVPSNDSGAPREAGQLGMLAGGCLEDGTAGVCHVGPSPDATCIARHSATNMRAGRDNERGQSSTTQRVGTGPSPAGGARLHSSPTVHSAVHDASTVEAVRTAILTLRNTAGISGVSFGAVVQLLKEKNMQRDGVVAVYSEDDIRAALYELARQEDVVLSSGSAPNVYLTASS